MYEKFGQFINGKWVKSSGANTVLNQLMRTLENCKANKKDIELALGQLKKVLMFGKILYMGKIKIIRNI